MITCAKGSFISLNVLNEYYEYRKHDRKIENKLHIIKSFKQLK